MLIKICQDPYVQYWLDRMRRHEKGLYRHSLRVAKLASDFYSFCGMDFNRGWTLIEGALLHDLGKVCLPTGILNKPRELDSEEKRMIALHPGIGAELLEAQGYFDKAVVNIVRRHHERLDGSGYPNGWRRQRTAKLVQVVAACDALCAMTEDRPYEDAWTSQDALARLKSMPNQYNLQIVTTLETMIGERRTSLSLYEQLPAARQNPAKRMVGVKRPRSAFFPPKARRSTSIVKGKS